MSSTAVAPAAPNRSLDLQMDDTAKPAPINFAQFLSGMSPSEEFLRTANYTKDPEAYLRSILGSDTFDERKDLLSLPTKFDKDIYGGGEHKTHFQQHIANLLGKKHGLFFITGVQAQLAALKVHCEHASNNRVAWHVTSHLETAEEKAYSVLYGMERRLLGSHDDENPTVEEIKAVLSLAEDERPAAIVLEIPNRVLGCKTYTFSELETISAACKEAGVKFHCDGARIWEIEPYYQKSAGKSFADIGHLFDSVYVSFYKGLRGATGAMLLSDDEALIAQAKTWQRRAGGNAFTLFYEVIDCERGYNENIGSFMAKWQKMTEIVDGISSSTAKFDTSHGNPVVRFVPDRATCCQIRTTFQGCTMEELLAARDKVAEKKNVRIFDRVRSKKPLDEQTEDEKTAKWQRKTQHPEADGESAKKPENDDRSHDIEWMIVGALMNIETQVFVDGYVGVKS